MADAVNVRHHASQHARHHVLSETRHVRKRINNKEIVRIATEGDLVRTDMSDRRALFWLYMKYEKTSIFVW